MRRPTTRALLFCLCLAHLTTSGAVTWAAEPMTDATWLAWRDHRIIVEKADGTTVTGELVAVKDTTVVFLTPSGEAVVVPREQVAAARLDEEAASSPRPAAPPEHKVVPAAPAAHEPPEPGLVQVHIESNEPLLQLYQDMGTVGSVSSSGNAVVFNTFSRLLCRTPCGVQVDGRNGQYYYLMAQDQRIGPRFQLHDQTGPVTLRANFSAFVSPAMRQAGSLLVVGGGASLVPGIVLVALGSSRRDDGMQVVGGVAFGVAAAAFAVGIPLLVLGRGRYDVEVPHGAAGHWPRFAGAGLVLPFPQPDGASSTGASASWSF